MSFSSEKFLCNLYFFQNFLPSISSDLSFWNASSLAFRPFGLIPRLNFFSLFSAPSYFLSTWSNFLDYIFQPFCLNYFYSGSHIFDFSKLYLVLSVAFYSTVFFLHVHSVFSDSSDDVKYGWDFFICNFYSVPCTVLIFSKLLFSVCFILSSLLKTFFNLLVIFVYSY